MDMMVNPLFSGSVVKIYNENRGLDYTVVARSEDSSQVYLLKNTNIKNDGTPMNGNVAVVNTERLFNKTDPFYFVPKIKRVSGQRFINEQETIAFLRGYGFMHAVPVERRDEIFPPYMAPDVTRAFTY